MLQCGSCGQQVVQAIPMLVNPVTWMLVLAAVTGALTLGGKKGDKK